MRREFHVRFYEGVGVRFPRATHLVIIFEREDDARRVEAVLPKRLSKYGLRIHPEKTRLIPFLRPGYGIRPTRRDGNRPGTFDFLGFTHYWARSRKGNWVVMQKTAAKRLRRALGRFDDWCREHLHDPLPAQREMLGKMLNGHYQYYGITGNFRSLQRLYRMVRRVWYKWLCRRSRKARKSWAWMDALLARLSLPRPRIVHSWFTRVANP